MNAAELKAQGNEAYKKGDYENAAELYSRLIETLKSNSFPDLEQLSIAYRNRSAAHIALHLYYQGNYDARMSYAKQYEGNFKACLRAALCNLRIGDLPFATTWVELAKKRAPTPNDPAINKKVRELEELIQKKRYFMSGGPFAKLKATEVVELLEIRSRGTSNYEDIPYLIYRLRHLLRAEFSKIKPDCDDFDIEDAPEGLTHICVDGEGFTLNKKNLSFRLRLIASRLLNGPKSHQPEKSRMNKLMSTPGCEDLFLSDLPDVTPEQTIYYEGGYFWERSKVSGDALFPAVQPVLRTKEEEETVRQDMAPRLMCEFTLAVLLGLAVLPNETGRRAYKQMGVIYSKPVYRGTCGDVFNDGIRGALPQGPFVTSLVAHGGLVGLATDITQIRMLFEKPFASTLDHIPTALFKQLPMDDLWEAVELLGDKMRDYHPDCPCCKENVGEDTAKHIAHAFVRMYEARGRKPFVLGARFSGCINYCVSRLWPEQPTGKPRLNPIKFETWLKLFDSWGTMHPGLKIHYELASSVPSIQASMVSESKPSYLCSNPDCDGSRAVLASTGLAKFKQCSICKRDAYCSKECQAADWGEHKKKCRPPGS